jgi:DNA-nicking Smr family endonuclease
MDAERKSGKRLLTAEEAELWTFAMREAKALRRKDRERERQKAAASQAQANGELSANGARTGPPPAPPQISAPPIARPKADQTKSPPPLSRFDDRQRRRIARDPELIDARLDLHGMRQREAHSVLRRFLVSCAGRGDRHVLVITGKGTRADMEHGRDYLAEERGVLRRLVPLWLGEPELRGLVISYTAASVRHGGEGALYVRLRKGRAVG